MSRLCSVYAARRTLYELSVRQSVAGNMRYPCVGGFKKEPMELRGYHAKPVKYRYPRRGEQDGHYTARLARAAHIHKYHVPPRDQSAHYALSTASIRGDVRARIGSQRLVKLDLNGKRTRGDDRTNRSKISLTGPRQRRTCQPVNANITRRERWYRRVQWHFRQSSRKRGSTDCHCFSFLPFLLYAKNFVVPHATPRRVVQPQAASISKSLTKYSTQQ